MVAKRMMTSEAKVFIGLLIISLMASGALLKVLDNDDYNVIYKYAYINGEKRKIPMHYLKSRTGESLQEFGRTTKKSSKRSLPPEVYVISLEKSNFDRFRERNDDDLSTSNNDSHKVEWFKGYDGYNQTLLDEWATLKNMIPINVSDHQKSDNHDTYKSPHTVGVFLSHWRLLEKVYESSKQPNQGVPDLILILEDDSVCVSNLIHRTLKVIQELPTSWDILYLGGKPFSYHTNGKSLYQYQHPQHIDNETTKKRPSDQELIQNMCLGKYGTSTTGPWAAGTSKKDPPKTTTGALLDQDPPYWQTKYVLNTHAYAINPKSISRILNVLKKPNDKKNNNYLPIDVVYSREMYREFFDPVNYFGDDSVSNAPLRGFMTPHVFCDQFDDKQPKHNKMDEPSEWLGFHWFPWKTFQIFPGPKSFIWGTNADRRTCRRFWDNSTLKKERKSYRGVVFAPKD